MSIATPSTSSPGGRSCCCCAALTTLFNVKGPNASAVQARLCKPVWKPDPLHRHQHRYWDGTSWTSQVADQGEQGVDAITITDTTLEGNTAASPSVPCELCGKRLDEKDPLNQHMAEVHGISPGGQPTGPAT